MQPDLDPKNMNDLRQAIDDSYAAVEEYFADLSDTTFARRKDDKWSVGENVDHLVLSSMGVASVLARDKSFFSQFGPSQRPSDAYPEMRNRYFGKIAGRKAPPNVSPDLTAPKSRAELLTSWRTIRQKLSDRLPAHWTEEELDQYQLPHPAFGMLTVREILYFMVFHNYHHLAAMRVAGE